MNRTENYDVLCQEEEKGFKMSESKFVGAINESVHSYRGTRYINVEKIMRLLHVTPLTSQISTRLRGHFANT